MCVSLHRGMKKKFVHTKQRIDEEIDLLRAEGAQ
jgi:hypothetical protein